MSQALYRKWRPRRWQEVVGQEHIVQTLRNAVNADRVAHAYLFAGPRGTGKTTLARLLAKAANCLEADLSLRPCDQCDNCKAVTEGRFLDLIEIDAASNTSVEDVRDLRERINFSPNQGRYKVYIVDEVHMLSTAAFNALLKTLEEPPSHAIFILATTEAHKIPATVLSRCQRHEFRRIPMKDIVASLSTIAEGEGLQISPEALNLVARQATGSLRDAISLLDQLASAGESISLELAHSVLGTTTNQAVLDVIEALVSGDARQGLEQIHGALDAGSDPRQFARQIVEYLRDLLLIRLGNAVQVDAPAEMRSQMTRHAQALEVPSLLQVLNAFNRAAVDARQSWQPALPLEMAYLESLERGSVLQNKPATGSTPEQAAAKPESAATGKQGKKPATSQPVTPPAETQEAKPDNPMDVTSPVGLTIDFIHQNWRQVLTLARQRNPQTQGLLNSCQPMGVKDGVLYLGFNSDFAKAKMEKPEHLEITQQVLAQVFGEKVPVRCVVAGEKRSKPPGDIDSDGMVAAALRDLGGEIVDIN
jgi:DNA polymerase-3 subunit gamma/tau